MILNVNVITYIVAFYTEQFMNIYKEGFVDVKNPFNPKMVSRINRSGKKVIKIIGKDKVKIRYDPIFLSDKHTLE